MKSSLNSLEALFVLAVTIGVGLQTEAINVPPHTAEYSFKPVAMPKGPGPVELELAVLAKYSDDIFLKDDGKYTELEIRITEVFNLEFLGDTVWTVKVDSGVWYKTILKVTIPPNDTSGMRISIKCGRGPNDDACYFVTKSDTVEVYKGHPGSYRQSESQVEENHIKRDTLTQEQLNKKYTIWLNLQKRSELKIAKEILGELADSCKVKEMKGVYLMKITLDQILRLEDEGIDLEPANEEEFYPPKDTTSPSPQKTDSIQPRGLNQISGLQKSKQLVNGISLDHVDGATPGGGLSIGPTIRFQLRLNNNSGSIITGMTNAFILYSPDGAQWQPPDNQAGNGSSIWNPSINWNLYFGTPSVFFRNVNGSGVDSIEFGAFRILEAGLPNGFNQIAWIIETHVDFSSNVGKTLCIDTVSRPEVAWLWALPNNTSFIPAWDGPHCFTITEGEISFSGYLYYLDPVPPTTDQKPMRFTTIEMWDYDVFPNPDDSLDYDYSLSNGFFSLGPSPQDDVSGGQDIYFKIYAENQAAYVTESFNNSVYRVQTPTQNDVPSGQYNTTIVADTAQSKFFGVADIVFEAYQAWVGFGPYAPAAVQVVLAAGVGTNFNFNQRTIYIDKSNNAPLAFPDTWDRYAIYHEYGHVIETDLDFFDVLGGQHSLTDFESIELASTEGFAHWIARVFSNNPILKNYYNNFNDYYWVNIENGEYGYNNGTLDSRNHYGKNYEIAVAGMLWDVYDNVNDNYSRFWDLVWPYWPDTDNVRDTLSLGSDEILQVCLKNTFSGHKPDNIDDFWESWFLPVSYSHANAMLDIWYEHGDNSLICIGIRGDVNADGMYDVSILDLVYMVDRFFRAGPRSPRPLEADVNASGGNPNVVDLTILVDRMFRGGPPPINCP